MKIVLPNDYAPRPYQEAAMRFLDNGGKRAITVWHRRAGKDIAAMHQTCKAAHLEKGVYWHIFPTSEEARRALWTGFTRDGRRIMEWVFPKEIRKSPREWSPQGEMVVELKCGSVWRLLGSDKMSVVGAGPKGVVFSEFALAKPTTWDLVRPMLRESRGWAWFITTPRGNNHAKRLYDQATPESGWYRDLKTVRDTGLTYASNRNPAAELSSDEMMGEEAAEGMAEELIQQEYLCSWTAANVGSFYGRLLALLEAQGRVGSEFASSGDDVFTFWDLGRADDTAIWWLRLREGTTKDEPRVDVLDHYACSGEPLKHYLRLVDARGERHGWRYRLHVLPHDARAKTLATEQSVLEQAVRHWGADRTAIAPELSLRDGIEAVRWILQQDIRFHARCMLVAEGRDCDGVEALRSYRREWDQDRKCFTEKPVHDWASHTADAFRYAALFIKQAEHMTRSARNRASEPRQIDTRMPTFNETYGELT